MHRYLIGGGSARLTELRTYEREEIIKKFLLEELSTMLWPTLIKVDFYDGEIFKDYPIGEDYDMLYRLFKKMKKVAVYQDDGYHYWKNPNSLVHNTTNIYKYGFWFDQSIAQVEEIKKEQPQFAKYTYYRRLFISSLIYRTIRDATETNEKRDLVVKLKRNIVASIPYIPFLDLNKKQIKEVLSAIKLLLSD